MSRAERIRRLQALFDQALSLEPGAREALLGEVAAEDATLAAELRVLLANDADSQASDRAIVGRVAPSAMRLARRRSDHLPWPEIPGYRLLREIGHGGMGSVVLAEREDEQFHHRVAIKLVRGFPSARILERFRRERDLLATLRHPNIARLYDGGTTGSGQPWLAMEYVEGVSLDEWCRQQRPSLQRRLRLFQALCSAVQHAHQKLIIHRDLKPGNVLVREDDQPVLLDFGIGKLLDEEEGRNDATRTRMFTPAYASPEQLRGEPASTLSDIFALGLILFELLTGKPMRQGSEATSGRLPSRVAVEGEAWLRADARLLRGDLDNIVRKAVHDDPDRRYASAAALAADIQAWFDGHPVAAAPDGWLYRSRKFVARHPVAVAATIGTLAVLAVLSLRLVQERAQARLEAEGANQAATFLVDLLKTSSPEVNRSETLTVRGLLDQAEQALATRQFSRPEVKARLEMALGDIYNSLGLYENSVELLESAVRRARGEARALGQARRMLALAYVSAGRFEDALRMAESALELNTQAYPPGHPEIGHTLLNLGVAKQHLRRHGEALAHFRAAQALFEGAGEEYRENVLSCMHNQGWSMYMANQYELAEPVLRRTLEAKEALLGPDHPSTLRTMRVLVQAAEAMGRPVEAAERGMELLRRQVGLVGEDSLTVAEIRSDLGSTLHDLGRYEDAEAQYRQAIDIYVRLESESLSAYAIPMNNLGNLYEDQERFAEAEAMYRRSLEVRIATGATPWSVARVYNNLGRLLLAAGRLDEAEAMAQEAWAVRSALEPEHHPERLDGLALLARVGNARGRRQDADELLAAWQRLARQTRLTPSRRVGMNRMLAEFARARADRASAVEATRMALAEMLGYLPPGHPRVAGQRIELARLLVDGDADARAEAARLVAQARATVERYYAEDGPTRRRLAELVGRL